MKKRHRRTKAEMAAFRASQIEKKANKYLERVEKKLEKKNVSAEMKIIKNPLEIPDDGKLYDIRSITGTESQMNEFYRTHKKDCIAVPYDVGNGLWQVNYYQEITEEEYKNRYRNLILPNRCQKA